MIFNRPPASKALLCLLALAPLWIVGILGRGYYTPDEPRERDIAWRMSQPDASMAVPSLAGTPFLEKPPAYYWLAALSQRVAPSLPTALRIPNLLYAGLAMLATLFWARAAGARNTGWLAALVGTSFLLSYRVAIWLATDALLVACVAVALLGAYRGYVAPPGRQKLAWYLLLHAAAASGFLAKSAIAWILPALALAAIILWERNWRELIRGELWAGLGLQVVIVGAWVLAVAERPTGHDDLRAFFWYNLVGRFMSLPDAPVTMRYADAHQNSPGKYLIELPIYLLPWTALALAAIRRGWQAIRNKAPTATAWRFTAGYAVAATIVLSAAATARDIYYAPLLPAFAVAIGLWAEDRMATPDAFDRAMLAITRWLVAFCWLLAAAVLAVGWLATKDVRVEATLAALVVGAGAWYLAWRAAADRSHSLALGSLYAAYAASVLGLAIALFPLLDRSQDLVGLARAVVSDTAQRDLALLMPDETTRAVFDVAAAGRALPILDSADEARARVEGDSKLAVFGLLPGPSTGPVRTWLAAHGLPVREKSSSGAAARIATDLGLTVERVYEIPDGRRYALWGK